MRLRADLLRRLRWFFDERGFLEVETPLLSHDTVVDRHLDPIPVTLFDDPRSPDSGPRMWLQTSPEFGMKRLLAAGAERIYQVTRAFRGAERGNLHNPEFTIAEWYRVGDSMAQGIELLSELTRELLSVESVRVTTYQEAFRRHVGVDPHTASERELRQVSQLRSIPVPQGMLDDDRDAWLDLLWATRVEPCLGLGVPDIVCDYPQTQAALAQIRPGSPPVAERFELYANGVELANGYHELLDPSILRDRIGRTNRDRQRDGKPTLPEESRLLLAMEQGLPDCVGVALGFDRVVMVAAKAKGVDEVMAFPTERA